MKRCRFLKLKNFNNDICIQLCLEIQTEYRRNDFTMENRISNLVTYMKSLKLSGKKVSADISLQTLNRHDMVISNAFDNILIIKHEHRNINVRHTLQKHAITPGNCSKHFFLYSIFLRLYRLVPFLHSLKEYLR